MNRSRSFSLLTLLLLVLIAALVTSQILMMRELAAARAELEDVRRKYGHIRVDNPEQTFVARITENEQGNTAYRVHIPPGRHYMVHLTDTSWSEEDYPADPQPTRTMSMNGWREGADVVLTYSIDWENGTPRVRVHTETEELFDYAMKDWADSADLSEASHLPADPQQAFSPDETIRFLWWRNFTTKRGVMLWMEPLAKWEARRAAKKSATKATAETHPE